MLHVTSRPIIDSGAFSVLYFYTFLLLIPSCGGFVIGPSHPLTALTGEDIILPCHLQPAVDVSRETVEWSRSDLEPRLVYVWRGSVDVETIEHPSYKGRASLFLDEMKHGNISLRLSKVRLSDGGTYRCFVPEMGSSSTVQLVVGAASSPVIQMSNNSNSGEGDGGRVVLQCESRGWYPEPEVLWLDAEGNLLSAGPPETVRGPDDLYTVSSRVTVDKRHSNSFTCRVQQNNINQTIEAHIHVADSSTPGSSSSSATIIGLIVAFVVIVAVSVFVWKWRQRRLKNKKHPNDEEMLREKKKKKNDPSTESLMKRRRDGETAEENNQQTEEGEKTTQRRGDEMESQRLMGEGKHGEELMDKEKEKLKTKLQAKEKEEKKGEERHSRLKSQIENKEKQINEVLQQLEEVEREMESEKREEDEMEKETLREEDETVKPPLETKKDLEKKKSELQKDLEKKKREKERMKKDETVLIEKRKKTTNEKEEIIRKLEEMKKQRNEGENQSDSDEDL